MIDLITGDARDVLRQLPEGHFNTCVTSPPYFGLRDYGMDGQIGLEQTPDPYVAALVEVFREVRRTLRDDGTLWLNLGDSYNNFRVSSKGQSVHNGDLRGKFEGRRPVDHNLKEKDLIGIPWRVAFALQADGWYLRQDIIWHKPNPMPESVRDRCTKAHEYIFLLSKGPRYYFDADALKEPSVTDPSDVRNKRSVWTVPVRPFKAAHFATFPVDLVVPCIRAGAPTGGFVLDPFGGAGTTGVAAQTWERNATLIELNPSYAEIARKRLAAA